MRKKPILNDIVQIKFAGKIRTGRLVEIANDDMYGERYIVESNKIFYPVSIDKTKLNYIIKIIT